MIGHWPTLEGSELVLGEALAKARLEGREIDRAIFRVEPSQAPRIQEAAVGACGGPIEGRVMIATTAATQRLTGCESPVWAPMLTVTRLDDGDRLDVNPTLLGIGVELQFRFGRAYPARGDDPSRLDEIADAIVSCQPALQILGRRFGRLLPMSRPAAIADFGLAAFCVRGSSLDWRAHDLRDLPFELTVDGHLHASGRGGELMGHPLEVLSHLARRLQRDGAWFDAGSFVATGSCTGLRQVVPGHTYVGRAGGQAVTLVTV